MLHSPSLQQAFQQVFQAEAAISAYLEQRFPHNDVFQEAAGTQPTFPPELQDVRKKLANAAAYLFQISIDPKEYLEQLSASNQHLVCLRWIINLDILQYIPASGSISYDDLATKASVPEHQLKSVIRMAAAHGFLREASPMKVSHSSASALVATDDSFLNWARWLTNYSVPSAYRFSEATQKWGMTEQKNQTSFNIAMDVDLPFFGYLKSNAKMNSMFSSYMRNVAASDATGFKHLISGFDWASLSPGATVVDVGGSGGHASRALATTFPELQFIVQDLPDTIENAKTAYKNVILVDDRIRFMPHDFFTMQPVTDADIYLLRMIIHDWPDESAITILSHIRDALKKTGARIIIMDTILPQPGTVALLQERQLRVRDLTMMQVFNAKEREYETWRNLIEKVGLKILSVNQPEGSNMGLLEVGLADSTKHNILAQPPKSTTTNGTTPHNNSLRPNGVSGDHGVPDVTFDSVTTASVDARNHPHQELPVLIMGAGISGLCLAQYLHKHHVPFLVFERDPSADYRPQGYRLKLEGDAATALQESLTKEVYAAFEASCAESYIGETDYNPISGSCIKSRSGGGLAGRQGLRATYTVDRSVFRRVLMTGIRDRIHFGRECCSYQVGEDGRSHVTAIFKDINNNNTVVTGRFLVGADGTRSVIRKQLVPQHKYFDTGAVCIYGKTTITQDLLQRYPAKALRWMTVCADTAPLIQSILIGESPLTLLSEPIRFSPESRAKATVPLPEDYVYWVLIGRREMFFDPADTTSASSPTNNNTSPTEKAFDEEAAKMSVAQSLALTEEWDSKLRSLFDLQDPRQTSTMRVVSAPPKIPAWETSPCVTLMGDAVHAMSPCGGVGANTALRDAAELGKLLAASVGATDLRDQQPSQELEGGMSLGHGRIGEQVSSSRSFVSAVAAFEEAMRKRAFGGIMRSFVGSKRMFDQRPFEELAVVED